MNEGRVDLSEYFMGIAIAVRERADCKGQKVGAVLVKDDRIIATGYNGTPEGFKNCSDGGCVRCLNRGKLYQSGTAYDLCICVHAEQNAILSAARFGIKTEGAVLYTTVQPCFGCLKESLQAKIRRIIYLHPWISGRDKDHESQYRRLQNEFPDGVQILGMTDHRKEWASSRSSVPLVSSPDPHGTELQ
jgi:dCMP deaminase